MQIPAVAGSNTQTAAQSSSETQGDFETFLRMLTTQIQNQDPLSPLQADEFASQLATFTMVEQQTLTNDRLQSLIDGLGKSDMSQYASVIGHTAVYSGPFQFSGSPVEFEFDADATLVPSNLVIRDASGNVIHSEIVGAGAQKLVWQGASSDGLLSNFGSYSAELRSVADDKKLDAPIYVASVVEEVRLQSGGASLLMADGTEVSETDVRKLR